MHLCEARRGEVRLQTKPPSRIKSAANVVVDRVHSRCGPKLLLISSPRAHKHLGLRSRTLSQRLPRGSRPPAFAYLAPLHSPLPLDPGSSPCFLDPTRRPPAHQPPSLSSDLKRQKQRPQRNKHRGSQSVPSLVATDGGVHRRSCASPDVSSTYMCLCLCLY